jgi:hypothetical protein
MEQQVSRVQKLTRGGSFRAWLVHVRAWLTLADRLDVFLDRDPVEDDDEEVARDNQGRAKLILCLGNDMVPIIEDRGTTFRALEALRADHLGHGQTMRSQIMRDVTAMKQSPKQNVKKYVAVGREAIVKLGEIGMEHSAAFAIPCFKNGIDARLKQNVLPLFNQERLDADFELLAQEFQGISIGMAGASGAEGQAHTTRDRSRSWTKHGSARGRGRTEHRTCIGERGHMARSCPKTKAEVESLLICYDQGRKVQRALAGAGSTKHMFPMDTRPKHTKNGLLRMGRNRACMAMLPCNPHRGKSSKIGCKWHSGARGFQAEAQEVR